MPQVPSGRQVRTAALPGVRKSAAETATSLGAGLADEQAQSARALGNLAGGVANIALGHIDRIQTQERDRADTIKALESENLLDEGINRWAHGDGQTDKGALARQGEDALGLPEEMSKRFDEIAGEIEAGLTTDRQKQRFLEVKLRKKGDLDGVVRRYVAGQITEYENQTFKATLENVVSNAGQNALEPRKVGAELARGEMAIRELARSRGVNIQTPEGREQLEKQLTDLRTAVHSTVINRLLDTDNTKAAAEYFADMKDEIAGDKLGELEKSLEAGQVRKESRDATSRILSQGGTMLEQLAKAEAIEDDKVATEVKQRIRQDWADVKRQEQLDEDVLLNDAYNTIDEFKSVDRIPATAWGRLGKYHSQLRAEALRLRKGDPKETDWEKYYNLKKLALDDPAKFMQVNPMQYRAFLDDQELKEIINLRTGGRGATASAEYQGFLTNTQLIDSSLETWGVDVNAKSGTPEAYAVAQLRRMIDRKTADYAAANNKKQPPNEWIQGQIDTIMSVRSTKPGSWWALPTFGLVGDLANKDVSILELRIGDLPATVRKEGEDLLRKYGIPVTEQTVMDWYRELLLRRAGGGK